MIKRLLRTGNKLKTLAVLLALVLALTAPAHAAVIVGSSATYNWQRSDEILVGAGASGENLVAVTLSIINVSGDTSRNPRVFDSAQTGLNGIYTLGQNKLHQQRLPGLVNTPTLDSPDFATDIDTHFLFTATIPPNSISSPATEQYDAATSSEPTNATGAFASSAATSFGDSLGVTIVLNGAVGATWNLAYIVVPDGTTIGVDAEIADGVGNKEVFDFNFAIGFVPEPSSLVMLGVGLMLIRHHKWKPRLA